MNRLRPLYGDTDKLRWISGTSNRLLAHSCFNDLGQLVDEEMFHAIVRWDRLEDAYNDHFDRQGKLVPPLRERYCIRDMLDHDLYDRLMLRFAGEVRPLRYPSHL